MRTTDPTDGGLSTESPDRINPDKLAKELYLVRKCMLELPDSMAPCCGSPCTYCQKTPAVHAPQAAIGAP